MAFDIGAAMDLAGEVAAQVQQLPAQVAGLVLHVDGDYLAYYASGNEDTTPGQARQNCIDYVAAFMAKTGAMSCVMHNTAKGCHKGERYIVATVKPYQGQRDSDRRPKNHAYLQDWLQTYEGPLFRVQNWMTREADDGIAACAHYAIGKAPGYIAIATADKDLRMLPGLHIDWKCCNHSEQLLTRVMPGDYEVLGANGKLYGLKWFWMQMLMGDTADHIPGLEAFIGFDAKGKETIKKMGEKTAEKFLADCVNNAQAFEIVAGLYKGYYKETWTDRFCEQASLLWMRCGNDASVIDFAAHKGHSNIGKHFCDETHAGAIRLNERVQAARAAINSLSDQAH